MATPVDQQKVVGYNGLQPFPIMYTEEDTFNRLRRIPIQEMRLMVRVMNRNEKSVRYVRAALKRFGWTATEYQRALLEIVNRE